VGFGEGLNTKILTLRKIWREKEEKKGGELKRDLKKLKLMSFQNSIYNSIGCLELVYVDLNEICLIPIQILANWFRALNMNLREKKISLKLSL
jgi:tRNA U34 5-methylaminomethyl-2-thiouridine-forming methyltransferase MnmC